ncbi:MAG: phosphate ABC transporter substrate-binding protein PstS [Deltaproteobacteria bacterium]|jgi:phosphate transport system substrate-binding protein|nr:phosphate ABC transporter substrate-binding protein PstS [Deltaproteobacteria bacterium]MDA8308448.1 phosphate ABC transporter substrate-binding protein PstS [Deltaproteobacteria bacterium]
MSFLRKAISIRRFGSIGTAAVFALALVAGASIGAGGVKAAESVSILETGSSLLYPLFNIWIPHYAKVDPAVQITTQSTGSGTGISESVQGIAQIGASDAYMSDALMKEHPMLNIPLCISMQMVNYNLPGLNGKHLKLSGPVLAGMYSGTILYWDDAAIKALNPGVKLPHHAIIPVHRTDGSGDTFIFSQYLSFSTPSWSKSVGYGTTVSWPPVPGGLGAEGNPGMVTATKDNPYTVAYIGTSYQNAIVKDKLGIAMLKNRAGNFVLPSAKTAESAAAALMPKTPKDERLSLIFAPGPNSYPIINYEYVMIKAKQESPETAAALRRLLTWAISPNGGNAPHFMQKVHFIPLPAPVVKLSKAQIAKIH